MSTIFRLMRARKRNFSMLDYSKTAFIFPGQGSQAVGMGKDFADNYPIARETIQQADDILGYSLSALMFEGPEANLSDTAITQPAMYVCSMAMLRVLRTLQPAAQPAFVAGHSLGEFTALTAANALAFEEGVRLVSERGKLMKEAGAQKPGGMAAVLGLDSDQAEALVTEATAVSGKPVVVANDNCPGQIVISGDSDALQVAIDLAKNYGAKRAIPLAVSVATHSPLMEYARPAFSKLVQETNFKAPEVPLYANVSAQPIQDVTAVRAELQAQLTSSVKWTQSMQGMLAAGITTFVEIGSKDVLTGLLKRISKEATGITINNLATLDAFVQL
jgi:[acyl-carrier-protein] S-malonyltransferase